MADDIYLVDGDDDNISVINNINSTCHLNSTSIMNLTKVASKSVCTLKYDSSKIESLLERISSLQTNNKSWDDFIRNLRKKHGLESKCNLIGMKTETTVNNDKKSSDTCQELLNDIYLDFGYQCFNNQNIIEEERIKRNEFFCFPTSSQGRPEALRRERKNKLLTKNWLCYNKKASSNSPILVEKQTTQRKQPTKSQSKTLFKTISTDAISPSLRSTVTQTNETSEGTNNLREIYVDNNKDVSNHSKVIAPELKTEHRPSIDSKLDELITSLNNLISEIRERKQKKSRTIKNGSSSSDNKVSTPKHDKKASKKVGNKDEIIYGMIIGSSGSNFNYETNIEDQMDKIIKKHSKSQKYRNQILGTTKSLIQTKNQLIEANGDNAATTNIPGYTDYLKLLSFVKITTNILNLFLSFIPKLNLSSSFRATQRSNFVCNVCGTAFEKSSQLRDHILAHNAVNIRDCCVCRHMLDKSFDRKPERIFSCVYCDKTFISSKCCDLHENCCPRRFENSQPRASISPNVCMSI